ncbi:MAG: aminoacyl-tRNA hydrolase [Acidimicrobiia bacterium]|nr:aminoacyl-tRNA hydrolase [Acidimicrobiia bacterium]
MQNHCLIVGLGNPGAEYELTPHNLGFLTVDRLADRHGIRVSRKESAALVGLGRMGAAEVILAKPQTFMNVSGPSVRALLGKYDLGPERLVLVYDELALPWMQIRIRPKGSSAGHNGVESVIRSVGTGEFARVRLGIHPGREVGDGAKFVLSPFRRAQWKELDELLEHAAQAVESIIAEGVEKSMANFNRRARGSNTEEE